MVPVEVVSRIMLGKFTDAELVVLEFLIRRFYADRDPSPVALNYHGLAASSNRDRMNIKRAANGLACRGMIRASGQDVTLGPLFIDSERKTTEVGRPQERLSTEVAQPQCTVFSEVAEPQYTKFTEVAQPHQTTVVHPETPVALDRNAGAPASSPPPTNINPNRRQSDARDETTEAERFAAEIREYVAGLSKGSKATAAEFGVLASSWHAEGFSASLVKAEILSTAKTIRVKDKWPQFVSRNLAEIRRAEKASRKPQDATTAAKPISEPSYFAKAPQDTPEAKAMRSAEARAAGERFLKANPNFKLPSRHAKSAIGRPAPAAKP